MKYIAVLDTDEIEDFAFFEDEKEKYLHAIDANSVNGEWIYLPFKSLEQEPTIRNCYGCKYSKNNHNAGTEECHLCMWENQYTPTTKNDLGVDCISREQALEPYKILENTDTLSVYTIRQNLAELPSVQPKEPRKGYWIKIGDRDLGWSDTVICKCSECEYQKEFMGKFDGHNLVIDVERADNYCSNCGSNMKGKLD